MGICHRKQKKQKPMIPIAPQPSQLNNTKALSQYSFTMRQRQTKLSEIPFLLFVFKNLLLKISHAEIIFPKDIAYHILSIYQRNTSTRTFADTYYTDPSKILHAQVRNPTSIVFDSSSNILVACSKPVQISVFSQAFVYLKSFGKSLTSVGDMAINKKTSQIIISDPEASEVHVYNQDYSFAFKFQCNKPGALTATKKGGLIIVAREDDGNTVSAYSKRGEFIKNISKPTGQLGLSVDDQDNIYVSHVNLLMVFKPINTDFKLINTFINRQDGAVAQYLCADGNGRVAIIARESVTLYWLYKNNERMMHHTSCGRRTYHDVSGMDLGPDGNIYAVGPDSNEILIFKGKGTWELWSSSSSEEEEESSQSK